MFLRPTFNLASRKPTNSAGKRGPGPKRRRVLRAEGLEKRAMLSASPNLGILTLDTSSSGALARSGGGSILVTNGDIVVDSASSSAATGSGSGNVTANNIYVHGSISNGGSGAFVGTISRGAAQLADPLASLPTPAVPIATIYAPTIDTTDTLSPGDYVGRIQIEAGAHVTLEPGIYYLQGGMSVTGGTVSGSGVTIFDESNSIVISGSSNVSLSAPTSGLYQGVVLFQSHGNIRPLSISNTAAVNLTGEVYLPNAPLDISGGTVTIAGNNSTVPGAIIAQDLNVSGGSLAVHANACGLTGDLSITKTDNLGGSSICDTEGLATSGGTIVYTIKVSNSGPSAAVAATVADAFPASFSSDTYTITATGGALDLTHTGGSGAINDSVYLPACSTLTYTVTAHISASATGLITNAATVAAPHLFADTCTADNTATDTDSLLKADLAITNTDNKTTAVPGTTDCYTIVVTNNGPNAVSGAKVKDLLAANADIACDTFTVATTGGAADTTHASSGSGSINDSVNMPVGSKITYTVTSSLLASATGTLTNTATVTPPANVADSITANNSATDSDTLTPNVDLVVNVCDSGSGTVVPGTQVTYRITVINCGPSNAVGAAIADALPAGITSDTYTAEGSHGASGFTASGSGNIDDTAVDLAAGASITYCITANVSAAATGSLAETATATAGSGETNVFSAESIFSVLAVIARGDTDTSSESGGTTTTTDTDELTPNVNLVVTATDNGGGSSQGAGTTGAAVPGSKLTYTVTVKNCGPSNAAGITVADLLPADIASDTYTAFGAGGASGYTTGGSGNIDDTAVNLASGASVTYTITATVDSSATGTLSNSASATAGSGETNINCNEVAEATTATDSDSLSPQSDLVVLATDNGGGSSAGTGTTGSVAPGGTITYTITVQNTGPSDAVGAAIADALPADITSDAYTAVGTTGASGFTASGTGNIDDASVNLAAGSSIIYTITAQIDASETGTLCNSATAAVGGGETNTNANEVSGVTTATDADTLVPGVNLVVSEAESNPSAVPGAQIFYVITVTNAGTSNAVDATVADALPAGIASDSYFAYGSSGASGFTASGSGNIDDTSVDLTPGASITYMVSASIDASATGTLTNTASATVGSGETNVFPLQSGGTTTASASASLSPQADLEVITTDDGGGSSGGSTGSVVPGETVAYTVTVQNVGPSDAVGAAVADALPAGITSDTYTAIGTSGASGFTASGTGNIDDASLNLASGASVTYTVVANVASSATGTLSNTATATVGSGETNTSANQSGGATSATVTDNLSPEVNLVVTKSDDGGGSSAGTTGNVLAGGAVTYTIVVQNSGPSDASGVAIADALPAGIISDTYTAVGAGSSSGYTASGSGNIGDTVNLASGASVTYTLVANIDPAASGSLSNTVTATVGSGETNTNPGEVSGTTSATDIDTVS